jgi:hypothetical protein
LVLLRGHILILLLFLNIGEVIKGHSGVQYFFLGGCVCSLFHFLEFAAAWFHQVLRTIPIHVAGTSFPCCKYDVSMHSFSISFPSILLQIVEDLELDGLTRIEEVIRRAPKALQKYHNSPVHDPTFEHKMFRHLSKHEEL